MVAQGKDHRHALRVDWPDQLVGSRRQDRERVVKIGRKRIDQCHPQRSAQGCVAEDIHLIVFRSRSEPALLEFQSGCRGHRQFVIDGEQSGGRSRSEDAPGLQDYRLELAQSMPTLVVPGPGELDAAWRAIATEAFPGRADFFFDRPASRDPADPDEQPDQLAGELQRMIDGAEAEVILISAYLVPTPELEEVVERIEARGVHVRILTNSLQSNNHLSAHAAYRKHINALIDHGADLHEVSTTATDRNLYMQTPVDEKQLGLHAKLLLVDDNLAFIGSCNLDPRSLKINTEVGLIIESEELNSALRQHLAIDFEPQNAWHVQRAEDGQLVWVGDGEVLNHQPSDSAIQRLEDWFIGLLPIDGQM